MKKHYPSDLTPRQWDCIKDLIPAAKAGGRPWRLDMHAVVNGILYVVVSGCQWRMLPQEYPCWKSVYHYFRQWSRSGDWQRLHDTLRAQVRRKNGKHKHPTVGSLDSQSVKAAAHDGIRGYDAGKHVKGRKRHGIVATLGLVLAVVVTAASVQDSAGAYQVLRRLGAAGKKLVRVWVDGGYGSSVIQWAKETLRLCLTLVPKLANQRGFHVLPHRWVSERTFGWFTLHRRLVKDYEVQTRHSESMIHVAMIRLMLKRLAAS